MHRTHTPKPTCTHTTRTAVCTHMYTHADTYTPPHVHVYHMAMHTSTHNMVDLCTHSTPVHTRPAHTCTPCTVVPAVVSATPTLLLFQALSRSWLQNFLPASVPSARRRRVRAGPLESSSPAQCPLSARVGSLWLQVPSPRDRSQFAEWTLWLRPLSQARGGLPQIRGSHFSGHLSGEGKTAEAGVSITDIPCGLAGSQG